MRCKNKQTKLLTIKNIKEMEKEIKKEMEIEDDSLSSFNKWKVLEDNLGAGVFVMYYKPINDKITIRKNGRLRKGEELLIKFSLCREYDKEVYKTVKSAVRSLELVTKTTAKKLLGKKIEEAKVWCEVENPHYTCAPCMQLYHKSHIMAIKNIN